MPYSKLKAASEGAFVSQSVGLLKTTINDAIKQSGRCVLGLSGGTTPRPVYEELGKQDLDWSKVWIYLVDDRYIDSESPDSNQQLVHETLLKHAGIPDSHIIFPHTDLSIEDCVRLYDESLRELFLKGDPDLQLLGMGEDGHIASLFPPLQKNAFGPDIVIHTTTDHFAVHDRISLTIPALQRSKSNLFLLKGEKKKNVWEEMMKSTEDERRWPAKALRQNATTTIITL